MRGSEACKGIVVFYIFLFEGFVHWGGREERIPGLEAFFQPRLGAPVSKTEARGSQEEPGGARGKQEEPGGARLREQATLGGFLDLVRDEGV